MNIITGKVDAAQKQYIHVLGWQVVVVPMLDSRLVVGLGYTFGL